MTMMQKMRLVCIMSHECNRAFADRCSLSFSCICSGRLLDILGFWGARSEKIEEEGESEKDLYVFLANFGSYSSTLTCFSRWRL